MPSIELIGSNQKRISYWEKLINDEDIPIEELYYLMIVRNRWKNIMNVFVESSNLAPSEFNSEAYLEYRRRVFEQLASEHDKGKEESSYTNEFISPPNQHFCKLDSSAYNIKCINETGKNSYDLQPSWDDSDLQAETYSFSAVEETADILVSVPTQWKANQTNNSNSILQPEIANDSQSATTATKTHHQTSPIMNWSSFDEQIKALSRRSTSENSIPRNCDANDNFNLHSGSLPRKSDASPHIQEQKLEREAVRSRLAFGVESDHENDDFIASSEKSWLNSERTFSPHSQSLHICYINETCSSDDSDSELPQNDSKFPASFSPTSCNSYSKMLERRRRSSNSTSSSSRNSLLSITSKSNHSSQRSNLDESARLNQAKRNELEIEARFQLAQAQQKAKIMAEAEKKIEKLQHRSSLAQRLLTDTLPEDTASKLKSHSLSRRDCRLMTIGQLQLILNDMHASKQGLNDELVSQLIKRDELQTEQDAKLTDLEDAKAMLDAMGPETTV